jgi:hypothetical protein
MMAIDTVFKLTLEQARADYPDASFQTTKETGKLCPCTECGHPVYVNAFYAPANAKCDEHIGGRKRNGGDGHGQAQAVHPGKTNPARVADLASVLINQHFARALCPVHPDDDEHQMELKSVDHHDYHGPSEFTLEKGKPTYRQVEQGETVMHQCLKCKAVVTYSTTAQIQFRRVNEPSANKKTMQSWEPWLGEREG